MLKLASAAGCVRVVCPLAFVGTGLLAAVAAFSAANRRSRRLFSASKMWIVAFLESIFQDPCPTLNGTRRVTMPQVLTRRREPIHPSSQARSPAPTNPKTGSGSDHPGGRSPQSQCSISLSSHWVQLHAEQLHPPPRLILSRSGYSCTLSNCTHRLVSHLTLTGCSCMLNNRTHHLV